MGDLDREAGGQGDGDWAGKFEISPWLGTVRHSSALAGRCFKLITVPSTGIKEGMLLSFLVPYYILELPFVGFRVQRMLVRCLE